MALQQQVQYVPQAQASYQEPAILPISISPWLQFWIISISLPSLSVSPCYNFDPKAAWLGEVAGGWGLLEDTCALAGAAATAARRRSYLLGSS
jgi:hypothetical protein